MLTVTIQKGDSDHLAPLRPLKAIRAKCLDCSVGDQKAVRECTIKSCPLWSYRLGKRPETVETKRNQ